jgi:2'-5' RNA ligase
LEHIVIPVGHDHLRVVEHLAAGAASAAGVERHPGEPAAHVTLLAYTGLSRAAIAHRVESVVAATRPFIFHAHGYGFFSGDDPSGLCLHVPVVRSPPLDSLHKALRDALSSTGADIARWSEPDIWSPHITLLDRHLDAERLGLAAGWLARRHHPSWDIVADHVALTGGWAEHDRPGYVVRMAPH